MESSTLSRETHWVRMFHAQYRDQMMDYEVLLDNRVWEEAQARMAALHWPESPAYYSVRVFMILRETDRPPTEADGHDH